MSDQMRPEGETVDQRLLGLSPEQVAELARRLYGEGQGPLDGPYVPTGEGTVRTASGRDPAAAETEGPLPAAPATEDGPAGSRPAQPPSGPTAEPSGTWLPTSYQSPPMSPELLRQVVAELTRREQGPPPGYQPPQDQGRMVEVEHHDHQPNQVDPVTVLRRWFHQGPELLRMALPSSRARSVTLWWLDNARLWFEEALRLRGEEAEAEYRARLEQDQAIPQQRG